MEQTNTRDTITKFALGFGLFIGGIALYIGVIDPMFNSPTPVTVAKTSCVEPENPFYDGSGHYAGYEWGHENGACSMETGSDSFNDGCNEFIQEYNSYQSCLSGTAKAVW